MTDRRVSEWDTINRLLAVVIGSHRSPGWSLGRQRDAASAGVWDDLVRRVVDRPVTPVTDSNMHSSCVFDVGANGDALDVSTVLPVFVVWSGVERRYLDEAPRWADGLVDVGFRFMGSAVTRTLSPYRDADADRRLTYFEILFEWIEGSDGPPAGELVDPWRPGRERREPDEREGRAPVAEHSVLTFVRVSDDEARGRRRTAARVAQELQRAGLPVARDSESAGAVIEVDQGADDAGGVYVTWNPSADLATAAAAAVGRGDVDDPRIEHAGHVSLVMRRAVVELLAAAGFDAVMTEPDDTRPLAVRVT